MQSHADRLAAIQTLAPERDWRYFTFYLGFMQTLGNESAGEKMRRLRAADEDAATYSVEDAVSIRETYLSLVLPTLADESDVDVRRAVLHVHGALLRCPRLGVEVAS